MAGPVRYGMMVDDKGASRTLAGGQWTFSQEYSDGSFIGQANRVRLEALKVAKRLNDQNQELQLAKATNRSPRIPDAMVRQQLAEKDQQTLAELRKAFDQIEGRVFEMEIGLSPYDYESPSVPAAVKDSTVNAQMRDRLFNAKDDKARMQLMSIPAYRKAAFEAPAEVSGVGKLTYDRMRAEDICGTLPG